MVKRLQELLSQRIGEKGIDVVVFASGGKDSLYALYVVSQQVEDPSRVLAFTMENGFLSDGARQNLQYFSERFGTQQEFWSIDQEILFSFYRKLTEAGPANPRSVCVGCNILSARMEYEALQKYQPPFFVTGNSSGEYTAFVSWLEKAGITQTGSDDVEFEYCHGFWEYYQKILKSLIDVSSPEFQALTTPEPKQGDVLSSCKRIRLFDYVDYNVTRIKKRLDEMGWKQPNDVIGTETDCTYTQAITFAFLREKGKKQYLELLQGLERDGKIPPEVATYAAERLTAVDPILAQKILNNVGYSKERKKGSSPLVNAVNDLLPIR